MKMIPSAARAKRLAPIALLLLIAAGATAWWVHEKSRPAAPPPPRTQLGPKAPTAAAPAQPPAKQASTQPETPPITDVFAVRNWEPPPPPPPTPNAAAPNAPPPPPEPPPLPFRYLGRIVESGKPDAFLLAQGNRVIAVSVGNVIDGTYRVEKYENGQLHFFYQPMKAHQTLAVGTMGSPS